MANTNYLKAGGILKFIGTSETDVHWFPASNCEMIEVASTSSVVLTFSQSGDNAVQSATLTTTVGKSDEVAAIMAQYIMVSGSGSGGSHGVTEFKADTAPLLDVPTTIAVSKPL